MRQLKESRGFVSIEAVLTMGVVFVVFLMIVGFYGYMYPRQMLEKEVHTLTQKAKIQGGLTDSSSEPADSDIEIFLKALEERGYNRNDIVITAKTNPGDVNAIGVTPLNGSGNNYISKSNKQIIQITVKVPANKKGLLGPFRALGITDALSDYYIFRESVLSERW